MISVIRKGLPTFGRFLDPRCRKLKKYGDIHDILFYESENPREKRTIANKMSEVSENNIVWIDMEMTGLDPETCHILEVGCLVTNSHLKIISPDFNVVINQSDSILDNMSEWSMTQHKKTGLTEASRNSKVFLEKAEQDLLRFVESYVPEKKCPIAGSSIYMDRMFLSKYMPRVNDYLHYRIIDGSSIKEIVRRWNYDVYKNAPVKSLSHRAIDDIRESIKELQYYKDNAFKIATL